MSVNTGSVSLAKMVLLVLAAISLMMVVALGTAPKAGAHQTAGRTNIYFDRCCFIKTTDDHFTFKYDLSSGCHTVKVVPKQGGEVISQSIRRSCSDEPTKLIVTLDHGSVSLQTIASDNDTTSDDA